MTGAGGGSMSAPCRPGSRSALARARPAPCWRRSLDHQPGAPRRRRPGGGGLGPDARRRRKPRNVVNIINSATVLYLSGIAVADRLPDEPVQHRRRRPVPHRRVRRRRRSPARPGCRATSTSLLAIVVAMAVGALWAGIAGVLQVTRGRQRGHLDDHAERHRDRAWSAYLLRKASVAGEGSNVIDTKTIPEGSRSAASRSFGDTRRERLRLRRCSPSSSGFALLVRAQPDPVRLRPAGHRALRDRRRRQRRQRQADDRRRDAALRRRRRPGRHADRCSATPHLRLDVPVRARLRRHRDRAARPQQPVGIAFGALLFAFLDEQSNPLQILAASRPTSS